MEKNKAGCSEVVKLNKASREGSLSVLEGGGGESLSGWRETIAEGKARTEALRRKDKID